MNDPNHQHKAELGSQALKFLCISVVTMMKATFAKHGKDESD
jgi:hypothetical protein